MAGSSVADQDLAREIYRLAALVDGVAAIVNGFVDQSAETIFSRQAFACGCLLEKIDEDLSNLAQGIELKRLTQMAAAA